MYHRDLFAIADRLQEASRLVKQVHYYVEDDEGVPGGLPLFLSTLAADLDDALDRAEGFAVEIETQFEREREAD